MLRKENGQVKLYTTNAGGFSAETLALADKLKKCYGQRAPWKNYNMSHVQTMLEEGSTFVNAEQLSSMDYVEWIDINEDAKFIEWGQGDFSVGCAIKDLDIIKMDDTDYYEDADPVIIGVKAGGLLVYDGEKIYKTDNEGFIGGYVEVTEENQDKITGGYKTVYVITGMEDGKPIGTSKQYGSIETEPILIMDKRVENEKHVEMDNFSLDCLGLVTRTGIYTEEGNKKYKNEWAVSCGYTDFINMLDETDTCADITNKIDCVLHGETDKEPDRDSLQYWRTVQVAYLGTQGTAPEITNTIEFATKSIFIDKNHNWWTDAQL